MYFRLLVQMKGIVRVTITHDGVGNNGINLDSSYARTAVAHGPQDVHAPSRSDDGVIAVGAEHIRQSRWRRHQITLPRALPMLGINVHQVRGRIGVDYDRLALAMGVHLHTRDGIPAHELDPCGIPESS